MTQVYVTVHYGVEQDADLSLPWEIPTEDLIRGLYTPFSLMRVSGQDLLIGVIRPEGFRQLSRSESLADARVLFGEHLELFRWQKAFLQTQSSQKFSFNDLVTSIGRSSPEKEVDIDLSDLDLPMLVSRMHASIFHYRNRYYIRDENSRNGTLVNGKLLKPGERFALTDKDIIKFGQKLGLEMVFCQDR